MKIAPGFSKLFLSMTTMVVLFAIGTPKQANGAIVFANFGPETIDNDNPSYTVPGFFGGNAVFAWQQLFVPSAARQGLFFTTGTSTLSLLTASPGGPVSILAPGTLIDGSTAGTWSASTSGQLLFDYAVGPNTFDPNLLTDTTTGIMGIRITSGADFYYGWFEITAIAVNAQSYDVAGLVYNNTPNAGVIAGNDTDPNAPPPGGAVPEPSSVGMLILGAAGVYAFRRRRDA